MNVIQLSKQDLAQIRASAGDLDGAGVAELEVRVFARLQKALDSGLIEGVTKNTLRAAITAELAAGK
jgi:hypothetical protein